MTLTDSVAVRMYEQRIDTLEGEVYSLQRDNEHLSREVQRLEHERDAAQDHAKGQSAEVQRYKLMYRKPAVNTSPSAKRSARYATSLLACKWSMTRQNANACKTSSIV